MDIANYAQTIKDMYHNVQGVTIRGRVSSAVIVEAKVPHT